MRNLIHVPSHNPLLQKRKKLNQLQWQGVKPLPAADGEVTVVNVLLEVLVVVVVEDVVVHRGVVTRMKMVSHL
jgi:hypothetical protein